MVLAGNVIETHPVKGLRRQPKSVTGLLQNQGEGAEGLEEGEGKIPPSFLGGGLTD